MDFDELKMPDYHILFSGKLIAGTTQDHIDVYGTSTYLNILQKDEKNDELTHLKDEIHKISDEIRSILTDILDEDDGYERFDMKKYTGYTMFNMSSICRRADDVKLLLLLPPSVSSDTFNTLYPAYKEIMDFEEKSVLAQQVADSNGADSKKKFDAVSDFFSTFNKGKPSFKTVYTDECREFIKKIKWFIREFMTNDDYIINAYKYLPFNKIEDDDRMARLMQIEEENVIGKLCQKVFDDIYHQYKIRYQFNERVIDGLKYKIIPEGFLFYRAYPNIKPPFPTERPYMHLGFSFLEISMYSAAKEEDVYKQIGERQIYTQSVCNLIGNVATFRAKKELKLLDLNDVETVEKLREILSVRSQYSEGDKIVLENFKKGWIIKDGIIKRYSEYKADYSVAQWVYDNNYDGFIGYGIKDFHDEVCVCSSKSKKDIEEVVEWGEKYPVQIANIFPMKYSVPACKEPFNQINYRLSIE
jgi:hypothetical protein